MRLQRVKDVVTEGNGCSYKGVKNVVTEGEERSYRGLRM